MSAPQLKLVVTWRRWMSCAMKSASRRKLRLSGFVFLLHYLLMPTLAVKGNKAYLQVLIQPSLSFPCEQLLLLRTLRA